MKNVADTLLLGISKGLLPELTEMGLMGPDLEAVSRNHHPCGCLPHWHPSKLS